MNKLTLLFCLCCCVYIATAQHIRPFPYKAERNITALAENENFVYVAGAPTWYEAHQYAVLFDSKTGQILPCSLRPNGGVREIVDAGGDNFFITGDFTSIGGLPIAHIARLRPDFSVDSSWRVQGQYSESLQGELFRWKSHANGEGLLFLTKYFLPRGIRGEKPLASEILAFNTKDGQWKYSRRRFENTRFLASDVSGVYFVTTLYRSEFSPNAPHRDSIFYYSPHNDEIRFITRFTYYSGTPRYAITNGVLHVVADLRKPQRDQTNECQWYCWRLDTEEWDTVLAQNISQQLQQKGWDLCSITFPDGTFKRRFVLGKGNYTDWAEWISPAQQFRFYTETKPMLYPEDTEMKLYANEFLFSEYSCYEKQKVQNSLGQTLLVGGFSGINGKETGNLSRFRKPDWQLDTTWTTQFDNSILELSLVGDKLFVSGWFDSVNHEKRPNVACFSNINDPNQTPVLTEFAANYKINSDLKILTHDSSYVYFYEDSYDSKSKKKFKFFTAVGQLPLEEDNLNKMKRTEAYIKQLFVVNGSFWMVKNHYPNFDITYTNHFKDIDKNDSLLMRSGTTPMYSPVFKTDKHLVWATYWSGVMANSITRINTQTLQTDGFKMSQARGMVVPNDSFVYAPLYGGDFNKNVPILRYNIAKQREEYFAFCNFFKTNGALEGMGLIQILGRDHVVLQGAFSELNGIPVPSGIAVISHQIDTVYMPLALITVPEKEREVPQAYLDEQQSQLKVSWSVLYTHPKDGFTLSILDEQGKVLKSSNVLVHNKMHGFSLEGLPNGKYKVSLFPKSAKQVMVYTLELSR